jgi:hypothetical protein
VLRWKGYRFFFYSADNWEPPHIHVYKDGKEAKIWLHDLTVAVNLGFYRPGIERDCAQGAGYERRLSGGLE